MENLTLLDLNNSTTSSFNFRTNFAFSMKVNKQIPMPVYNPSTGEKVYQGMVEREVNQDFTYILNFETGEVAGFSPKISNFGFVMTKIYTIP